jgi:hypothetical protein
MKKENAMKRKTDDGLPWFLSEAKRVIEFLETKR